MTGQAYATYNTRQAAYDLRKLRGKQFVSKPARTGTPMPAAAVLAWVTVHGGIAIIDEKAVTYIGDANGITVRGSLWLVIRAFKAKGGR